MKIILKTSLGAKCGIEDLALLSVYPSLFGVLYFGTVSPNWPNALNTLKQELICQIVFTLDSVQNFIGKGFFQLGFTPCKAEQPLRGMELQEKEAQKD